MAKKTTYAIMLASILSWISLADDITAFAAAPDNQGYIRVGMKGSIIDTPCNITGPDEDQIVDIGVEPVGDIIHNGRGSQRAFSIRLVNCSLKSSTPWLPDASRFQITFDGKSDGTLFGIDGNASGVGLEIIDAEGNIAIPGTPLPTEQLLTGDMQLNYILRLVGDRHRLHAGNYHSTIRFKIEYN